MGKDCPRSGRTRSLHSSIVTRLIGITFQAGNKQTSFTS
jgi:hypothetical protein